MTAGGDAGHYGDRVAATFFKHDMGIMISSAVNENPNLHESFKDELKAEEWNDVVISQEFEGPKLMYNVSKST